MRAANTGTVYDKTVRHEFRLVEREHKLDILE